jgi:hypothetical protein
MSVIEFGPEKIEVFPCWYRDGREVRLKTMADAIASARRNLPSGEIFEVRMRPRGDIGRDQGIMWYYVPDSAAPEYRVTSAGELFQKDVDEGEVVDGYLLLARIKV